MALSTRCSMRRAIIALAIGVLLTTFFAWSPGWAKGKLDISAKFTSGQVELHVATYTGDDGKKVGLLGIASPQRVSFAFNLGEWAALINLATKAIKTQSASRTVVGSMTEVGTTDTSHLTVSAGPGVRFVISDPKRGTNTYTLQKADAARFEKALGDVKAYLSGN